MADGLTAAILAVGSELLTPQKTDTNSLYITEVLNDLGIAVAFKSIVGDNRAAHLSRRVELAQEWADLIASDLLPAEQLLDRPRQVRVSAAQSAQTTAAD